MVQTCYVNAEEAGRDQQWVQVGLSCVEDSDRFVGFFCFVLFYICDFEIDS